MALSVQDQPTFPPSQLSERVQAELYGWDETNQVWRRQAVSSSGGIIVVVSVVPGTTITSPASTTVGAAATVPLTAPPAGTTRMTIQVRTGDSSTQVLIRELGGIAGAGRALTLLGSTMFGGVDGAIAPLEAENLGSVDANVSISFEGA